MNQAFLKNDFKINLVVLSIQFLIAIFSLSCQTKKETQPNILILLADDMGYGDLGSYGGVAKTPNLDKLALDGIRFTECYSGAPNCSPARVSLLTGRAPTRVGMYSYRPPNHVMHLRDQEVTIAELLKTNGYQTAHFGKWHLSCLPQDTSLNQPQPNQQGFEYSLGTENNSLPSHLNPINFVRNGKEVGELKGYSSQLLADEVEGWFKKDYKNDAPFFMYVPFHEPHAKVAAPPELVAHYADYDKKSAEYFACIENMDLAVGRILVLLESKGLKENTLIFFASDNGSYRYESNGELRGKKGGIYDGGIKVPGIFSWPKVFGKNRVSNVPIWFPDVLPTVSHFAGITPPLDRRIDGINLMPLLEEDEGLSREQPMLWYFYRSSPEVAMRKGDYMLVARAYDTIRRTHHMSDIDMPFTKDFKPDFFELYDVSKDAGQLNDLALSEAEKLDEMKLEFSALFDDIKNEGPYWEGLPEYNPKKAGHNKVKEFQSNQERFLNK
jgi:arylsulfatase A